MEHLRVANMQLPNDAPTVRAIEEISRRLSTRDETALTQLRRAAEGRPDDMQGEIALVRKLRELGRDAEALRRFADLDKDFASDAEWQAEYAVTLVEQNDRDGAIARYRRCLELAPDDADRMIELAMLLLERREGVDLDDAWRLAERARHLAPGAWRPLVCQAELLALRGDLAAAVRLYEAAIAGLSPGSPQRRVLEARAKTLGK
jgi:Flp pilus assembly protein TadD